MGRCDEDCFNNLYCAIDNISKQTVDTPVREIDLNEEITVKVNDEVVSGRWYKVGEGFMTKRDILKAALPILEEIRKSREYETWVCKIPIGSIKPEDDLLFVYIESLLTSPVDKK